MLILRYRADNIDVYIWYVRYGCNIIKHWYINNIDNGFFVDDVNTVDKLKNKK